MLIPVPFATADDLAARWRTLSAAEEAQATILLTDASYLILTDCPSANDVEIGELDLRAATLMRIVCAMVKRAMIDGADSAGVSETQQTAGPFSFRDKFANPNGDLYLTKAERRSLPCGGQVAFTVPMVSYEEGS